jgi:hypothetical protein
MVVLIPEVESVDFQPRINRRENTPPSFDDRSTN